MKQQARRGPVASRLGLKVKVANNLSFDARQKIKQKQQQQQQPQQQPNKPSVKVRIGNPNFQDARQKIMQKTKFVDARERIRNKKPDNTKAGGNSQPGDMRIKINNAKAKKVPVAINRNAANQGQGATQVTVTGQGRLLTKPGGGVQAVNGSLVKVITQSQETPPVKFKGQLKSPEERQNRFQAKSAPAAIRVTKSFDEISSTPASSLPGGGGVIRVRNEFFQPQPAPVYQAPQPRTMYHHHQHMEPGMESPAAVYVPQILPEHFDMAPPVHQAPAPYHSQAEMPMFRKTVQNTAPAPAPAPVPQPAPLKLRPAVSEPVSSTTQGVRVVITNLHPVVTEDDVVELFSVAGELKRARLLRPGTAEVVYGAREHALSAVRKYHHRELDGVPMTVQIVSAPPPPRKVPVAARLEASPSPPPPAPAPAPVRQQQPQPQPRPQSQSPTEEFQPLKLFKGPAKGAPATKSNIDVTAVHKALFKTKEPGPVKPVTFTVKI